jgi:hypothetical protein
MPEILLGLVVLLLLLWAASAFIKADPKQVARILRGIGGVAALLLATFLLFRGAIGVAIPIGAFGLGSAWLGVLLAGFFGGANSKKRGPSVTRADGLPGNGTRS